MNEDVKRTVTAALDAVAAQVSNGKTLAEAAIEVADFLGVVSASLRLAANSEQVNRVLDALPDPSAEELGIFQAICTFLPQIIDRRLMMGVELIMSERPEDVGGRPPAVPAERNKQIVKEIGLLYGKGRTRIGVAKRRVAACHGISLSSVDRLWSKRDVLLEDKPVSLDEAKRLLKSLLPELFDRTNDGASIPPKDSGRKNKS